MRATLLLGRQYRDSLNVVTNSLQIIHFGHSCVLVETGSARLLFDPGTLSHGFEDLRDLDAILITHQHFDHLDADRLPALVQANPQATLVVDPGSAEEEIAKLALQATVARPGDVIELNGAVVHGVGGEHAVIHPEFSMPPNVGYVVDHGAFYHPGDSFFVPEQKIDVLGLPAAAPWMKVGEAIDFQRAVAPRVSVPIHDAMLSDIGKQGTAGWFTRLAPEGTEVRVLTPLEPVEI
jgi:L-ascorbate metabolism protein UlaG (beta-lactamase superfamily)